MSRIPLQNLGGAGGAARTPTLFRVHGTQPGSPEEVAVIDVLAGQIRQFTLGQRQQRDIGAREVYRVSRTFDDYAFTYTHMHGTEIVDVHVSVKLMERIMSPRRRPLQAEDTDYLMDMMVWFRIYAENLE